MSKTFKFFPLTLAIGLILLNFDFFSRILFFRVLGRGFIVLSIVLFFIKYFPLRNERNQHDRTKKY